MTEEQKFKTQHVIGRVAVSDVILTPGESKRLRDVSFASDCSLQVSETIFFPFSLCVLFFQMATKIVRT